MMYMVKLVKMNYCTLDLLLTMMAQYALEVLQNVVIDDQARDTYKK